MNVGVSIGVSIDVRHSISINQKIELIKHHEVNCQSSLQISNVINNLIDQGVLTEQNETYNNCLKCGVIIGQLDNKCPACSYEQNNEEENLDWEEISEREEEQEMLYENKVMAKNISLAESIEEVLITHGVIEEAKQISRRLQDYWYKDRQYRPQAFYDNLSDDMKSLSLLLVKEIVRVCLDFSYKTLQTSTPPPAELDIYIDESNQLKVGFVGKFDDFDVDDTTTEIEMGEYKMSAGEWLKKQKIRRENLESIGNFVVKERGFIFKEKRNQAIWVNLQKKSLPQQAAVKSTGISASTISRWCNLEQGIWLRTPIGYMRLGMFFLARQAQSIKQHENDTAIMMLDITLDFLEENIKLTGAQLIEQLNDQDIYIGKTRASQYLKEARIVKVLLRHDDKKLNIDQFRRECDYCYLKQQRPSIRGAEELSTYYKKAKLIKNLR